LFFTGPTTCEHGSAWSQEDPVQHNWQVQGFIYKGASTTTLDVYYRPTVGDCDCRLYGDGQTDLLFHYKPGHLFYYGLLFQQLSFLCEGRCPIATLWRSCKRSNRYLSRTALVSYQMLRGAWNSFIRLLDIDWEAVFTCTNCGPQPPVVVCDGTDLGFRRDFLVYCSSISDQPSPGSSTPITGLTHKERVYVSKRKGRDLLSKFLSKGLTAQEVRAFKTNVPPPLSVFCSSISVLNGDLKVITTEHTTFLKQLALNTPVHGIFQTAPGSDVWEALDGVLDSCSLSTSDARFLDQHTPIVSSFLKVACDESGSFPEAAVALLRHLMDNISLCERLAVQSYPQPSERSDGLSFFPNMPLVRGRQTYTADRPTTKTTLDEDIDRCNKSATSHATLTPCIFTLFCPCGHSPGFAALTNPESPKHPFEIFLTRYDTPPSLVIYDNSCKLHTYALYREPHFFRHTKFLVDRLHFRKGHTACSLGYSMDSYRTNRDIRMTNSQINEQANAGLQRLKGQLAYMTPDNFMYHIRLYLALLNDDLQSV
jgi:hypothetical protein